MENVSYGIEPLESSATYEHIVYQIKDKKIDFSPIAENYSTTQLTDKSYKIFVKSEVSSNSFYGIFIYATGGNHILIEICLIWKTNLNWHWL